MANNGKVLQIKKRLSSHKSLRLHLIEKLRLFEDGKINEDKLKAIGYTIKIMADLLDKEKNVERIEELEKEVKEFKELVKDIV